MLLATQARLANASDWASVRAEGLAALTNGDYTTAEKRLQNALRLTDSFRTSDPRVETSLNDLARLYAKEKKFARARSLYLKVLKINEMRYDAENPALIPALNNLIKITCAGGLCYDTIPELKRLLAIRQKAYGDISREVPPTLLMIGEAYEKHKNYRDALTYFKQAVAVQKKLTGETSTIVLALSKNVDRVMKETGE